MARVKEADGHLQTHPSNADPTDIHPDILPFCRSFSRPSPVHFAGSEGIERLKSI
jgi:hypothetical protein